MRKKLIMLIIVLFTIFPTQVWAQDYNKVIKWSPIDMYLNQANFSLEQNQGKNSIIIDIGIPLNRSINNNTYNYTKLGVQSVRFAYRHYTSNVFYKYTMTGFYYEPYIRENTIMFNAIPPTINLKFNSYLYATSLGIQTGYQWRIHNNITIDLYFAGLEVGRANGRLIAYYKNPVDGLKMIDFINQKVEQNLPKYALKNYQIGMLDGAVSATLNNTPYIGFRGGISVGIAF